MNALSFILSGETGFFKKPDVNQTTYFTFMHIHKPALLGIFGSLIGAMGYSDCYENKKEYPDYYSQLINLQIAIIPIFEPKRFSFKTTIETYTNTTGFANGGATDIIDEQWLKKPCWRIIVKDDESDSFNEIKERLMNSESFFEPYLGKNNHPAVFSQVELVEIKEIAKDDFVKLDSLSLYDDVLDTKGLSGRKIPYMYREFLPCELSPNICSYIKKEMFLTNQEVNMKCPVYQLNELFFTLN